MRNARQASENIPKKIAIFAPSHSVSATNLQLGIRQLEDSGFEVDCPKDIISPPIEGCKWANTAEERTRRIINILNDPTVGAMWAVDGGESAIEVVNLLNEYDTNPEKVKTQILDSYLKTQESLPDNFFLPKRSDLFDYSKGALPKRGIPCIGFSDVSGVNNFLGQRGVVSPYYANVLDSSGRTKVLEHLMGEKKESKYEGLTLLGEGQFSSEESLEVYATVDGWIASSCGTDFQFTLQKPSILAIESIEEGNVVGLTMQQAFEAGALENVKAIVIGRISGGQVGDNLEKYPALKEFVEKSGIAVFTTNGTLKTGENTFGHGKGGITEPFVNFASASLSKNENGSYGLEVSGNRSQENLDFYYQSRQPVASKVQIFSDHPKTVGDISVKVEELQPINADEKQPRLSGSEVVHANYRELRLTNGTKRQADLKDKVLIISGNDGSDDEKCFLHQSLVENHLSGSISGAKAVIIVMPAYHPKETLVETLKALTTPLPYIQTDHDNYSLEGFPVQNFENYLKPDLDKIKTGGLSYVFEPQGDRTSGTVTIKITNKDLVEQTRREGYEKGINSFKEMLADAAEKYLPHTPIYLALDEKLVKNINDGIGSGTLSINRQRGIDIPDLALPNKPSPSPEKSYAEKMVGESKGGFKEV